MSKNPKIPIEPAVVEGDRDITEKEVKNKPEGLSGFDKLKNLTETPPHIKKILTELEDDGLSFKEALREIDLIIKEAIKEYRLDDRSNGHVDIIYEDKKGDYFHKFNQALKTTDILWTKPSELSFFSGLGLPIIMAPSIGSQENFNKAWLQAIGSGVEQADPRYTNEWLFEWVKSGWLAEAAMQGFLDAPKNAIYHIEDIVLKGKRSEIEDIHLL